MIADCSPSALQRETGVSRFSAWVAIWRTISPAGRSSRTRPADSPAASGKLSMSPSTKSVGGIPPYLKNSGPNSISVRCDRPISCPSPGRLPFGGRPARSHSSTTFVRRVRRGASGHSPSNRVPHIVSVATASITRCLYLGWAAASTEPRNRVPIQTPSAPQRERCRQAAAVADPSGRN